MYISSFTNAFVLVICVWTKTNFQCKFFKEHHTWQFLWDWYSWCVDEHYGLSWVFKSTTVYSHILMSKQASGILYIKRFCNCWRKRYLFTDVASQGWRTNKRNRQAPKFFVTLHIAHQFLQLWTHWRIFLCIFPMRFFYSRLYGDHGDVSIHIYRISVSLCLDNIEIIAFCAEWKKTLMKTYRRKIWNMLFTSLFKEYF